MYGKTFDTVLNTDNGTSPETIIKALGENGIMATEMNNATFENIPDKSIAYYPNADHYVTIEKHEGDKILVNDSLMDKPMLMTKEMFTKDWNGYLITTKQSN
jgi:ABC-type bacteriocin/lantibiotic exporter with double-glycine peptidase domain